MQAAVQLSLFDFGRKRCFKCGESKAIAEFYKHAAMRDGYLNKCKACQCEDMRRVRLASLNEYRRRDRARYYTQPHRQQLARKSSREYSPALRRLAKEAWALRNPEKRGAHAKVRQAIASGALRRQSCEGCGTDSRVHAHHDDYSRPLAVRWLCPRCHGLQHRKGA